MLNQKRSGNLARLKYLAVIPICAGLLCTSTLAFSKTYGWLNILPAKNLDVLQTAVTKNADTIVRLKLSSDSRTTINKDTIVRLKLSGDKMILPPPPPPVPPKKAKADDMLTLTNVKPSHRAQDGSLRNTKADKVVRITDVKLMPPPPPPKDPLDSFYKYVMKNVHYPASARKGLIAGRVIIQFDVANGKIDNLKITRGLSTDIDAEALRVLNNYPGVMNVSAGTYSVPIAFALQGKGDKLITGDDIRKNDAAGKSADASPANSGNSFSTVYSLNEIVIVGYAIK